MLNKSVLKNSDIKYILNEYYSTNDMEKINLITSGSACIYVADNGIHKFIVKEYQEGYSINSIEDEYNICEYLNLNGIKTSEILKNKSGFHYIIYKGRHITVQKHIDGFVPKQNEAPDWLMKESAQLLGKINAVLSKYKIDRHEFTTEWFNNSNFDRKIKEYEKLIVSAKEKNNEYTDIIINDLEYKIKNIENISKTNFNNTELTYANSHGDYSLLQLLCNDNEINAVIDFVSACNLPIIWEIIRSFTYADKKCKDTQINIYSLIEYFENSLLFYPLKIEDIKNIFKVYTIQLLRSAYGYKEYFIDNVYDKEKLLRFGFWRTSLLRNILENEKEYTDNLLKWYGNR
jgi:Ser/Thr protein kinase RdoA (MazF antagonist)